MSPRSHITSNDYITQDKLPEYLETLREGLKEYGDTRLPINSKPEWFDAEKFHRGRKVAMDNFFGITSAVILSLYIVYNIPVALGALIYTGQSSTPFTAFKRYISTIVRIKSWYEDDVFDPTSEGYRHLKYTRKVHELVRSKMQSSEPEEIQKKLTLKSTWSPLCENLRQDFGSSCPVPKVRVQETDDNGKNPPFINQTEMAILQFSFVGLFVRYPGRFGNRNISQEDLDSFVHLWATLGYLLGVDDKYNFCIGSVQTVNQRSDDIINFICKPSLRAVTPEWEHMVRSMLVGISYYVKWVSFEPLFLYLCDVLCLEVPRLRGSLTFIQNIVYYALHTINWVVCRVPILLVPFNRMMLMNIETGATASPEWINKLQKKKYPFNEQENILHRQ